MKSTLRHHHLFATASLAAAAALLPVARAQSDKNEAKDVERPMVQQHLADQTANGAATTISIASDDAKHVKDHTAKKLAGHKIRGSDGKDLGSVKDFLVDAHAGTVNYAIISSGGVAGVGDKLRLVPFGALQESTEKKDTFALNCDKATFEQLPVVAADEFKDGRYTVSSSQRQQLAKLDANASASVSVDVSSYLVRASDIAGKELHSGATDIGKIEAVVIDTDARTATALFDPKNDFTSKKQKFLVPLAKLQIAGAKHDPITTTLTRTEFEQVGTSSVSATTNTNASQSVAASTTAAPAPVSAPAAAGSQAMEKKSEQANTTASNNTSTNTDTVASATRSVSRAAIPPADKTAQSPSEAQKTGIASTEASQDLAIATGATKESSATSEQKELSPTGRTRSDGDKSVAANTTSSTTSSEKSGESSKATTTDMVGADASKAVAQNSDQSDKSRAPTSTHDDQQANAQASSSAVAANDSSTRTGASTNSAEIEKKSTDVASAGQSAAKASDKSASSTASDSAVAANDSATNAGASTNNADAQKKTTDVGSTDQSSTKAAGSVASTTADKSRSATTNDQELSPTGKQSSDSTPAGKPELVATAQSIRKALDDDATLAHLDVQVTPENDTIVLRGNVTDQRLANAIEKRAHEKGGGTKIDNQIRVQSK